MDLPDDSPRLPKLPFLLGDVALLAIAAYIAYQSAAAPSLPAVLGIIVCAGMGVAIGVAPFIMDYSRQQDLVMRDRERIMESLVRSTSSAADQASIAANGLNEIAETTKANLRAIEGLPAQVQAARDAALRKNKEKTSEDLTELKAELTKLADSLSALEKLLQEQNQGLSDKVDAQAEVLKALSEKPPAPPTPVEEEPKPRKPRSTRKPKEVEEPASLFDEPPAPAEEQPKPTKRKRAKKTKPAAEALPATEESADTDSCESVAQEPPAADASDSKPEVQGAPAEDIEDSPDAAAKQVSWEDPPKPAAAGEVEAPVDDPAADESEAPELRDEIEVVKSETSPEEPSEPELTEEPSAVEENDPPAEPEPIAAEPVELEEEDEPMLDEPAPEEPALSADGTTRLTVTAYIGIGNRLFIRGNGPGLSQEEGIPLQFVSIGKWRWETDAAVDPMKVSLWKNDEEPCTALGELDLKPGQQLETTANF